MLHVSLGRMDAESRQPLATAFLNHCETTTTDIERITGVIGPWTH
jgi:hypothetical protein